MIDSTCSLRFNEIRNLKTSDIDTTNMTFHIFPSKCGKDRTLVLCRDAYKAFQVYSRHFHVKRHGYLFSVRNNGSRPAKETLRRHFKHHLQLAGLDLNISFHVFRHTLANNLCANGVDSFSLMTFLGHSSLGATSRHMHLAQLKKASYAKVLDHMIGGVINV